jgi:hypothetical protein
VKVRYLVPLGLLLALAVVMSCGDPVHEAEVSALGPEAPGVPPGPTHRPGQPCLTCHGGEGPGGLTFVTAGTVYVNPYTPGTTTYAPLVDGTVALVDATGHTYNATTNTVGNFFVATDQWSATFPLGEYTPDGGTPASTIDITVAPAGMPTNTTPMTTAIERGGVYASCAYCHFDPPGPTTPGHVYQQ